MLHYYLKQSIGLLGMPLVIGLLIVALALAYQLRGRPRAACRLILVAALLTYLASTRLVGDALLGPLEGRYASLSDERPPPQVGSVVVLGSDYRPRAGILTAAALDADGLVRVVEGIRLTRRLGSARLVVSGGAPPGKVPPALGYADFARRSGVPEASIVTLGGSLDTHAEVRAVAELLGPAPFILVTSAYHMPRALWLMERAGAHAIPAPVGQRVRGMDGNLIGVLIPGSSGLYETEHALHEYIGLLAMTLGLD
jgi:uncharacterized SAM-binding protein YcdF (DUF218 family)